MNQPCYIELLGGLHIRQGDRVISRFRTQKTAVLLAYLAYFLKRSHPREELIELLWPDTDPKDSRASLRMALSSLRRQLEPPGTPYNSVLVADRLNVRLNPQVVSTDAARFQSLVQSASHIEETAERVQALTRAVELYHNPLLPGYYEEWVMRERERLEHIRIAAQREITDLLEQRGERERLLREEPDAVPSSAAQAVAARLSDVRQTDTTSGATTLRPSLVLVASPTPVPHSSTPVSPTSQPLSPHLPLHLRPFFGREDEMARLQQMLQPGQTRLLTLTGSGGSGKTRLAVEVARKMAESYNGRIWFVPLSDITDAELILVTLLSALGLALAARQDPMEQIAQTLGHRPSLLILDNFEQLVEAGTPIIWTLLERIPTVTCLLTSRQRLDLGGEREFPVQPLPVPTVPGTPEKLVAFPSVCLFVDRAQIARPDFQITRENVAAVAALCERLEGIPLAIELAAAWAATMTPTQMLSRLENRFAFLASRRKDRFARHRTLYDAIEWSYRLLTPELQRFFARLSVFRGGWSLEAAEAIWKEEVIRIHPLSFILPPLDALSQLQERSLIVTEEAGSQMRFRLLESLREYAWDRLVESGEAKIVCGRHRDYFLALAEASGPKMQGLEQSATLVMLETEHDNLREALRFSNEQRAGNEQRAMSNERRAMSNEVAESSLSPQSSVLSPDDEAGLRLAVALSPFWEVRGYLGEGRKWLASLLSGSGNASVIRRAKALAQAGTLARHQADYVPARVFFEESLSLFRLLGDKQGIAETVRGLGVLAEEQGDYEAARAFLEESLAIKRELGDRRGLAASLNSLANLVSDQGEYASARLLYEESLMLRRELEDMRGVAAVLTNLGLTMYEQADYAAARAFHTEGLALHRALVDKQGIAASLNNLAIVAHVLGDYPQARSLYEESLVIRRELGDQRGIAISLNNLGDLAWREGQSTSAWSLYHEGLAIRRQLGDRRGVASSLAHLGNLAAGQGDHASARSLYVESLVIRRNLEDKRGIAECLEKIAGCRVRQEPEQAARLFGAAESLREAIDAPVPPMEKAAYDGEVMALQARLPEEVFTFAWRDGRTMTMEQAIEYALQSEDAVRV